MSELWTLSDTEMFARYGDALVPRRAEQISTVCDLLTDIPVRRVLDLCCGEGLLAQEYLRRWPDGQVLLLDGSAEMLALAASRLGEASGQAEQLQADIADSGDRSWRAGRGYGAVMSSLAVHHLDGPGKRQLFRDVREMLAPGGAFVLADVIEPAGPVTRRLAGDHWDEAVARASREQFGGDEASRAFREQGWNYYRLSGPDPLDKPSSVAEQLDWLREAGFAEADVAWLYAGHAIFSARRLAL